jgi:hypothetical protein
MYDVLRLKKTTNNQVPRLQIQKYRKKPNQLFLRQTFFGSFFSCVSLFIFILHSLRENNVFSPKKRCNTVQMNIVLKMQ